MSAFFCTKAIKYNILTVAIILIFSLSLNKPAKYKSPYKKIFLLVF